MARPKDRKSFPDCPGCPYVGRGPWAICAPCASERLVSISDPCPLCAQERGGQSCRNRLCTGQAGKVHIAGIEAITLHTDPLDTVMARYKYHGKTGWATIFARLLVGHLEDSWVSRPLDLVVANPPNPNRHHTATVIRRAAPSRRSRQVALRLDGGPCDSQTARNPEVSRRELRREAVGGQAARRSSSVPPQRPHRRTAHHRLRRHLHHRATAQRGSPAPPRMGRRFGPRSRARPSAVVVLRNR